MAGEPTLWAGEAVREAPDASAEPRDAPASRRDASPEPRDAVSPARDQPRERQDDETLLPSRARDLTLKPMNPAFPPIVLEDVEEDAVHVTAELVEVLALSPPLIES